MVEEYGSEMDEMEMQMLSRPAIIKQENAILEQMDLNPLLLELKLAFLGKKYDPIKKEFVDEGKAIMNETGFQRFKAMCKTTLQRNTLLSNLDINDINAICIDFCDDAIWLIAEKHVDFNIDIADRDIIVNTLHNILYMTLKRAERGLERKSARETMNISEIRRNDLTQDKKKRRYSLGPI